jgi:alcohol dehydrogenase
LQGFTAEGLEVTRVLIDQEPSTSFIDHVCSQYRDSGFDCVLGVGGGSVIDGAKAISAMLPQSGSVLDFLEEVGSGTPHPGTKLPYIACPTTSGTGGEMTKNAVLSEVGPQGYRKSLRHDALIPDLVVVDPELMITCPRHVTAACGMDAFTQLLESYLSPKASPFTDAIAWAGLEAARTHLLAACGSGAQSLEVRGGMAFASLFSGVALANAGLGIVHGLASPLGGKFPIPHGVVCGTLVAEATRVNWTALSRQKSEAAGIAREKFARVGRLFGAPHLADTASAAQYLVDALTDWTEQLELPRLSAYGIGEDSFADILAGTSLRQNAVALELDEIQSILAARI